MIRRIWIRFGRDSCCHLPTACSRYDSNGVLERVSIMDFSAAVEALYRLNTGVIGTETGRHERPHKPVLLLAVFDALASGKAQPNRVEWSAWLRERFRIYFDQVRSH